MSGNKGWFSKLDENFKGKVKMGNDTHIAVMGKGTIKMKVNGLMHVITHVYYVPELKNNLLSIGQLQEKGLHIRIQSNTCTITNLEKEVLCEIPMNASRMFVLTTTMEANMCLQMNTESYS